MILDFHMNGAVTLRPSWRLGVREPRTPAFAVSAVGSTAAWKFSDSRFRRVGLAFWIAVTWRPRVS